MVTIRRARTPEDVDAVRVLFREYQQALVATDGAAAEAHICFQSFESELEALDGMYGAPGGALLFAVDDEGPVGCVGVRATAVPGACEMKRLYLRARARGTGAGRRLAEAALTAGGELGYGRMVLDTLPTMKPAIALYGRLGFETCQPYYDGAPVATLYFERTL